jgi:hypothetical protein
MSRTAPFCKSSKGALMASRVATTIEPAIDRRLRIVAALEGKSITRVLCERLDKALPTDAELAETVRGPEAIPA